MQHTTLVSRSLGLCLMLAVALTGCTDPAAGGVEQEEAISSPPSSVADTARAETVVSADAVEADDAETVGAADDTPAVSQLTAAVLRARPIFSPPWGFTVHRYVPQPN